MAEDRKLGEAVASAVGSGREHEGTASRGLYWSKRLKSWVPTRAQAPCLDTDMLDEDLLGAADALERLEEAEVEVEVEIERLTKERDEARAALNAKPLTMEEVFGPPDVEALVADNDRLRDEVEEWKERAGIAWADYQDAIAGQPAQKARAERAEAEVERLRGEAQRQREEFSKICDDCPGRGRGAEVERLRSWLATAADGMAAAGDEASARRLRAAIAEEVESDG